MQKKMTRREKEAAGLTKPTQSKYEQKRANERALAKAEKVYEGQT